MVLPAVRTPKMTKFVMKKVDAIVLRCAVSSGCLFFLLYVQSVVKQQCSRGMQFALLAGPQPKALFNEPKQDGGG